MRGGRLALLIVAGLVWANGASASALTLEWNATPACASKMEVMDDVLSILRGASGSERQVVARVTLNRDDDDSWRVALVTQSDGSPHERSFAAESCEAAVEALALILAIAINPQVIPPAPTSAPTPTPTSTPTSTPAGRRTPWSLHNLTLAASFAIDTGTLPHPAVGAEFAFGWMPGRLHVEIAGTYWAPQTANAAQSPTSGAHFQLLSAAARAAYVWPVNAFALGPLVSAGLENLNAVGFGGTAENGTANQVLGALAAGGVFAWRPAPHLALRAALESVFPLSRPTFAVLEPTPSPPSAVHRPAVASGRAFLGVEASFL